LVVAVTTVDHYAQATPSHVELTTPDQQAAMGFYGPLLGWGFEDVEIGEAGVYVAVSVQGASIAGIAGQIPQLAGHPAFWGVYSAGRRWSATRREPSWRSCRTPQMVHDLTTEPGEH
jgi:predicted enzyme related to lactoylglutathione lyase